MEDMHIAATLAEPPEGHALLVALADELIANIDYILAVASGRLPVPGDLTVDDLLFNHVAELDPWLRSMGFLPPTMIYAENPGAYVKAWRCFLTNTRPFFGVHVTPQGQVQLANFIGRQ